MSYITGNDPVKKDERGYLSFDKEAFIFATNFASNTYFANDLNWKRIALYFTDSMENQRQIIILKDGHTKGWFTPSATARTGNWALSSIEIFDQDGDSFVVERTNMPSPETFDVAVQRVIAPASSINSIESMGEGVNMLLGAPVSHVGFTDILISNQLITGREYSLTITGSGTHNISAWAGGDSYEGNVAVGTYLFTATHSTLYVAMFNGTSSSTDLHLTDSYATNSIVVTTDEGQFYSVGYKIKIWDDVANAFLDETIYELIEVNSDTFVLDQLLPESVKGKTLRARFPNYADVSGEQAAKYEYVEAGY